MISYFVTASNSPQYLMAICPKISIVFTARFICANKSMSYTSSSRVI